MNAKIKVTLSYRGSLRFTSSRDYQIEKLVGVPTIEVAMIVKAEDGTDRISGTMEVVRVGGLISEDQANELATRVEVTTIKR